MHNVGLLLLIEQLDDVVLYSIAQHVVRDFILSVQNNVSELPEIFDHKLALDVTNDDLLGILIV